jgi:uncharacterized membrane protein
LVTSNRVSCIDTLRGVAIVLMVAFHFCYDLEYFKIYNFHITSNPFFLNWRIFIVSLFLFLVGVSLALSHQNGIKWQKVKKRAFLLGVVALLISLVSYFLFPHSWIYFGIIHFIFFASLVGLYFVNKKTLAFLVGVAILLLYAFKIISMHYFFINLAPLLHLPLYHTEDLAPFIPWFGVVLLGISLSNIVIKVCKVEKIEQFSQKLKLLNLLGRHSLVIYITHQIILFALFFVILSIIA